MLKVPKNSFTLTGRGGGNQPYPIQRTVITLLGGGWRKKQSERIAALEQTLDRLVTGQKLIRTEWEDSLDRMNRIMGRLNARIRRAQESDEATETTPEANETAPEPASHVLGSHGMLSEMRRRRGLLPR